MKTYLYATRLKGIEHYCISVVRDHIQIGSEVKLIPEHDNPYDEYAIRVEFLFIKIGYLKAGLKELHSMLRRKNGCKMKAYVSDIIGNFQEVRLTIEYV